MHPVLITTGIQTVKTNKQIKRIKAPDYIFSPSPPSSMKFKLVVFTLLGWRTEKVETISHPHWRKGRTQHGTLNKQTDQNVTMD